MPTLPPPPCAVDPSAMHVVVPTCGSCPASVLVLEIASGRWLVAEVHSRLVVGTAAAAAAWHRCRTVALVAPESGFAVRVLIAIALACATLPGRCAAGKALVDERLCACTTKFEIETSQSLKFDFKIPFQKYPMGFSLQFHTFRCFRRLAYGFFGGGRIRERNRGRRGKQRKRACSTTDPLVVPPKY